MNLFCRVFLISGLISLTSGCQQSDDEGGIIPPPDGPARERVEEPPLNSEDSIFGETGDEGDSPADDNSITDPGPADNNPGNDLTAPPSTPVQPEAPVVEVPEVEETIFTAIREGDIDKVSDFIEAGVDVDLADPTGKSPLITAAEWNRSEIIVLLLEAGVDPGQTDSTGKSALDYAEEFGFEEVAVLLKGEEISIDELNAALIIAAKEGDEEAIIYNIETGADIDFQDPAGNTALIWSVIQGKNSAAILLLELGADPTIKGKTRGREMSALDWAKYRRNAELVAVLQSATGS